MLNIYILRFLIVYLVFKTFIGLFIETFMEIFNFIIREWLKGKKETRINLKFYFNSPYRHEIMMCN